MTVSFDKRLAELDAYLQMLLEKNEALDKRIESAHGSAEKDGLELIKSNLESLLGSIKHAIVLLQIAKVSITSSNTPERPPIREKGSFKSSTSTRIKDKPFRSSTSSSTSQVSTSQDDNLTCNNDSNLKSNNFTTSTTPHNNSINIRNDKLNQSDVQEDDEDTFYDADDEHQLQKTTNIADSTSLNQASTSLSSSSVDWDTLYGDDDEDDLGSLEAEGSVIKHLISQIRIGMDLTKVVLPTFILERRSLLEMYADFFAHPDLFSSIPDQSNPETRFVQLVKWYLSAFHAGRKSSVAKKPYNPILGEIFICHWNLNENNRNISAPEGLKPEITTSINSEDEDLVKQYSNKIGDDSLLFVSEQVSHHPPVSAFYTENRAKKISCCAHIYTKSKYLGLSVGVHHIGQGVIKLLDHNETYTCTFPSAFGRSILTVPWVELGGPVQINCEQTGFKANIEFHTKPFYGGKKHRVTGELLRPNNTCFLTIDGEWNGCIYSKRPEMGERHVFVDTAKLPVISKNVRPIACQESFESRNVWKEVTLALKKRDVTKATEAKCRVEQRQRDSLKDRIERQIEWETRFFRAGPNDSWTFNKNGL